jgi:hypothetical protein
LAARDSRAVARSYKAGAAADLAATLSHFTACTLGKNGKKAAKRGIPSCSFSKNLP